MTERASQPVRMLLRVALLAAAGLTPLAGMTQSACEPLQIAWPSAENPVWQLTALQPSLSSGPDGSGLEVRDVRYRGRMVLKRGHVPMLNVRYETACGCFRDWLRENWSFEADNVTGACIARPEHGSVRTICDTGVEGGDIGSFTGIAMTDFGTGFTLTTHSRSGWYRYTMKWTFELDGTIHPEFGFSNTPSSCTLNPRWHHAYWRLDFDIETADGNSVHVSREGGPFLNIPQETTQRWDPPADGLAPTTWAVVNNATGHGYTLTPGSSEYLTPANPNTGNPTFDDFAREDIAFSRYREGQLTDARAGCDVRFAEGNNPIVQGQDLSDHDVVVWYRTGVTKVGGHDEACEPFGPVLRPIGDWGQGVGSDPDAPPARLVLTVFPNPFGDGATVRFASIDAQRVRIVVFDALGREVRRLFDGPAPAGQDQELRIDGTDLPSGIYTVRLTTDAGESVDRRIVLVR